MTKINKLVMHGFKSFAKRTELVFGDKFNCILGPNGSGKSNVLDAICFVLGKSSAKALRTEKSANLIYNGGKTKKPSKEAEVSIYFDNSKKEFPTEDSEVKITRMLKQNGQSSYKINNQIRTRQEILELMALARINPDAYNIILQGDIIRFVEMNTVERRQLVEEIAGISVYEEKKQKAINEMQTVEEKLKEAEIVLSERENSLKQLKKERDQAIKYKELKDRIQINKATSLFRKIEVKQTEKNEIDSKISEEKKKLDEKQKEISEIKEKIKQLKENIEKINAEIEQKGEKEQVDLHKEIEQLKVDFASSKNRIESLKNEISRIKERKDQLNQNFDDIENKIKKLEEEKKELLRQTEISEKEQQNINSRIEQFKKKNKLDNLEGIEKDVDEIDKQAEEKQKQIQELRQKQQELLREKDKLEFQISSIDDKIEKVLAVEEENKAQVKELKNKKQEFKKTTLELNQLLNDDSSLAAQVGNARSTLLLANENISKLRARNAALQATLETDTALRKLMENKKKIKGIFGPISELGQVNSEYALALEVAAGNKIKSIVVDSDKTAADCIKFLRENKYGVARFIPLNKIKSRPKSSEAEEFAKTNGVRGFAIDLVTFDQKFKNAFSYVFGETLVVENIDVSRRIGIGKVKMATLDGDVAELSGAMQGGYRQRRAGLGFKEKEVSKDLEKYEKQAEEAQEIISTLEKRRADSEERIVRLREFKVNLEADVIKLEKTLYLEAGDIDVNKKEKENLKDNLKNTEKKIDSNVSAISEVNKELAQNRIKRQELRAKITQLRSPTLIAELNTFEQKKQELREEIIKKHGEIGNIGSQIENILLPEKENSLKIIKQHSKEEEQFNNEIKDINQKIKKVESDLKEKEKKEKLFYSKFKSLFTERTKIDEEISKKDSKVDNINEDAKKLEHKINTMALDDARVRTELAALEQEFKQYEGTEIDKQKSEQQLNREIEQFERMVESIGGVNLRSLEIYEQVEKEYSELLNKKERLKTEKNDILIMMNEIEVKKKELFLKTLEVVDNNFRKIFSQLSTKGECSLALENKDMPFEAGLLIKVRITGTKFLDIRSLSGGEKTLTALAFIFAIQDHDPASFYVLDEVDAALDKRNSEKLGHLIRKYTSRAQYVVISHNDGIISEADYLYGVSMDEHSTSNVVSLKI